MGCGQAGRNASPAARKPSLPSPRQSADRSRDGEDRVAESSPRRNLWRRRGVQGQKDSRTPRVVTPSRGDQRRDDGRQVNQSRSNSPAALVAPPPSAELPLLVVVNEAAAVAGVEGGGVGAEPGSVPPTLRSRSERSLVTDLPIDCTLPASHRVAGSFSEDRIQRSSPGRSSVSRGSSLRSSSSRRRRQSASRSRGRDDRPPVVLRPRDSPSRRGAIPAGGVERMSPRPPPGGRVPHPPPRRVVTRGSRGLSQGSVPGSQGQWRSPGVGRGGGGAGGWGMAPPSRPNL